MSKRAKYKLLSESLRLWEIVLMTGFSFIGVLFTDVQAWSNPIRNTALIFFVLFYVMTVYFLNSFAGHEKDIQSQRLKVIGTITKPKYFKLFLLFACLFVALALSINLTVFVFSIIALLLWVLYYLPPFQLKSTLLWGTFIHLTAGIFHFHTGYCSYAVISERSVSISVFFALLLCVGHLHHEMIDYEADKNAGNQTTAVRIGLYKTYWLRTILAGISLCYWTDVYQRNYISKTEYVLFGVPTFALFIVSIMMKTNTVQKFQQISRSMFLWAGLGLLVIKLMELVKGYF